MNTEFFIAKRLLFDKESKASVSRPILRISVVSISLSLAIMIVSVAIVTGFKNEIRKKIIGFGSHIQIVNYDSNNSFETEPVQKTQSFYPSLDTIFGINHIQIFATKPGMLKAGETIQGAIVKGIGSDFDWAFFEDNLVEGSIFKVNDSVRTDKVLLSKYLAQLLNLKVGDRFAMYFIDEKPRARPFTVSGIYETSLEEFDKQFVLADIGHIQRLNNWNEDQVTGFEVILDDFDDIEYLTYVVNSIAGTTFLDDGSKLRVINIKQKYPQIFDWLGLIDWNVLIIIVIMLVVAFFNTSSGLLIMILDQTSMIGILKSLGSENSTIRKIFLYQAAYLLIKGLFWGNLIGLILCFAQSYFKLLKLDQSSYFIDYVPININVLHLVMLNLGSLLLTLIVLLLPSMIVSRISPARTIRFN